MEIEIGRTADTVMMVRPADFGYNEETARDNAFQNRPDTDAALVNRKANIEFEKMVETLRKEGVAVLVLEPPEDQRTRTPDAVFPNNWFSTEHDGTLLTYPMMAENRRAERRVQDVERLLSDSGYTIRNCINVGRIDEPSQFLEGTGSLVIDHVDEVVYAARSQRCDVRQFDNFIRLRFYKKGILFDTKSTDGTPIYHTNVMMSLGENFAVVCAACIEGDGDRARVLQSLHRSFDVVEISPAQMERHFCGNILQVKNDSGEPLIVMSENARDGFASAQRRRLEHHGRIVSVDLSTIEAVGGGSARCMMAEIFSVRNRRSQAA